MIKEIGIFLVLGFVSYKNKIKKIHNMLLNNKIPIA
jgi:hypothetical protein